MSRMTLAALWAVGLPLVTATAARAAEPVPEPVAVDRLTVTVDDGDQHVATYELACHPTAGTLPDAQAACDRMDALGGPVGPPPAGQMCTMIYGGPQKATVVGTWRGVPVRARYNRANGCETARWQDMEPVLPAPVPAGG